jgi:lipopolysaccharide export system permease protein
LISLAREQAVSPPKVVKRWELVIRLYQCCVDWPGDDVTAQIDYLDVAAPMPEDLFGGDKRRRPSLQTFGELFSLRSLVQGSIETRLRDAEVFDAHGAMASGPESTRLRRAAATVRRFEIPYSERLVRGINSEIQMRPAIAASCLSLVMLGCPIGIWVKRRDFLSAFICCFVPTLMLFYPIEVASLRLSNDGLCGAGVIWSANGFALTAAIVLTHRLLRR